MIGWIVVVSLVLAALRLATILALIALCGCFLWALALHPLQTVSACVLLAAMSYAKAQPAVAVSLLLTGILIFRVSPEI